MKQCGSGRARVGVCVEKQHVFKTSTSVRLMQAFNPSTRGAEASLVYMVSSRPVRTAQTNT